MRAEIVEEFSDVVEAIYAASMKPSDWPSCLEKIAHLHQAERSALMTLSRPVDDAGQIIAFNFSTDIQRTWNEQFAAIDPWVANSIRKGLLVEGNSFTGEELIPDTELITTRFYNEFLTTVGIRHLCAGIVFSGSSPELPFTSCTVYRSERLGNFDKDATGLHGLLIRHLSRALGAMHKLQDLEMRVANSVQALDLLPGAVVLLASRGHVLFANKAARAIFSMDDGLTIRAGHPLRDGLGWLRGSNSQQQSVLDRTIKSALELDPLDAPHFSNAGMVGRKSGRRDYLVRACPLADSSDFDDSPKKAAGLLFITDPDADLRLDTDAVMQLYNLTPAELKVAGELLKGEPLKDVASNLGVGEATVKTHLQNLFAKTQTSRQQQLVRLLMSQCR